MENFGKDFPAGSVLLHNVKAVDTLRSIANAYFGNASLWYLIADANGLKGDETLVAGQVLRVPSKVQSGALTSDTHSVYNENEIIGSKLPNIKSPPPPKKKKGCASFLIILIVIVATIFTAGAWGIAFGATGASGVFATGISVRGWRRINGD